GLCTGQNSTFTDQSSNSPTSWAWTFIGGTPASSSAQNPVVSYSASGTYSVTLVATNAQGSSSPSTQTISVNAAPTPTAVASATVVCAGKHVVLTGSGATSYTWSPGTHVAASYTATPSSATVYTLTGMSSSCIGTATVSVGVNPLPTLVLTPSQDTICTGGATTLTISGATNYTWTPAASLNTTSGATVT